MTLPRFLCIGAQKAGTSWLFAQLQSHPKVWMPPLKELQYFNHLYVPEHRAWTTWHIRQGAARVLEYHVGRDEGPDFGYVRYLADLGSRELFTDGWYRRAFERPGTRASSSARSPRSIRRSPRPASGTSGRCSARSGSST